MPRFLLLKHYRGGPEAHHDMPPMDRWSPEAVDAHMRSLEAISRMLEESGELVDAQALHEQRVYVRFGGDGAPPVTTDGPYPETSDLVAGWYMVDVDSRERALEIAAHVSAGPDQDGNPMHEWIEVRQVMHGGAPGED